MDIQRATLRDLFAVYNLERDIFPKDAYPYLDLALLLAFPRVVNFKAVDAERQVVGFVSGIPEWRPTRPAWIITLGVARGHQERGIGSKLLQCCEDKLKRQTICLTVRRSNLPALNLYRKRGYQIVQTKRRYYRDGEDGFVMEKQHPS